MPTDDAAMPDHPPQGRTARRLGWSHLPPELREQITERLGSPVARASSCDSGYTPGFASVLVTEDGRRHFVKAASVAAQRPFAEAYRQEARTLATLPSGVPAPRLEWSLEGSWVVLGIEHVPARLPHRPWREADLAAATDALAVAARALTPAPVGLNLATFATEFADLPGHWRHVAASRPGLAHLDEAALLAAEFDRACAGETLVHTDIRDGNLLLRSDGSALVCDWTFPVRGAPWLDLVLFLVGPAGDGAEVDRLLAEHELTRRVPATDVDRVIALLAGFFAKSADDPVPTSSPYLRRHQAWYRDAAWGWLCRRRGWR